MIRIARASVQRATPCLLVALASCASTPPDLSPKPIRPPPGTSASTPPASATPTPAPTPIPTMPTPSAPPPVASAPPTPAPSPAAPAAGQGDLLCTSTSTKFYTSAACLRACAGGALASAFCLVKPTCPGLQTGTTFNSLYEQASGAGAVPALLGLEQQQIAATKVILQQFFKRGPEVHVQIGNKPDPGDWAHLAGAMPDGKTYYLTVQSIAFPQMSPGALVAALGHEMIHLEQRKRTYGSSNMVNIQDVVDALREVEAYSWETGQPAGFRWQDHGDSTLACGQESERTETQAWAACYQWKVQHLIAGHVAKGHTLTLSELKAWLAIDPWTSAVWVKQHPDWASFTDAPAPVFTTGTGQVNCGET